MIPPPVGRKATWCGLDVFPSRGCVGVGTGVPRPRSGEVLRRAVHVLLLEPLLHRRHSVLFHRGAGHQSSVVPGLAHSLGIGNGACGGSSRRRAVSENDWRKMSIWMCGVLHFTFLVSLCRGMFLWHSRCFQGRPLLLHEKGSQSQAMHLSNVLWRDSLERNEHMSTFQWIYMLKCIYVFQSIQKFHRMHVLKKGRHIE